jgi:magnesium-protoporphyrin O-methyltransferase
MTCCSHCVDAEDQLFNPRTARRDLRRYRRRGPLPSTRLLVEALRGQLAGDRTLLDVGGGVGAVQHELLKEGIAAAVQVDASRPYLEKSREEAERQGHADRVTYHHADYVELAPSLAPADVVTLDRVICCYPDLDRLVEASASKAKHLYGLVYPRERVPVRVMLTAGNAFFRLRRSAYRAYLHPEARVEEAVRRQGFRRTSHARTFLWNVVTYAREAEA